MTTPPLKPSDPKSPMTQRLANIQLPDDDEDVPRNLAPRIEVTDQKYKDAALLELDPASLDPNRHYRWVRLDANAKSVARAKRRGYTIERKRKGGPTPLADTDSRADSAIAIGDLILMSCPKSLAEERIDSRRRRTENLLQSTAAETEQAAAEKGIKIIKDPDHGRVTTENR